MTRVQDLFDRFTVVLDAHYATKHPGHDGPLRFKSVDTGSVVLRYCQICDARLENW